jgi:hypothetical protein
MRYRVGPTAGSVATISLAFAVAIAGGDASAGREYKRRTRQERCLAQRGRRTAPSLLPGGQPITHYSLPSCVGPRLPLVGQASRLTASNRLPTDAPLGTCSSVRSGARRTVRSWRNRSHQMHVKTSGHACFGTDAPAGGVESRQPPRSKRSLLCQVSVAISEFGCDRLGRSWALEDENQGV